MLLSSTYNLNISGKILHAKWDDWKNLSKYEKVLSETDIYTLKRVSPSDRGFKWKKKKKIIYDRLFAPYEKNRRNKVLNNAKKKS